jgi:hypothetical protein
VSTQLEGGTGGGEAGAALVVVGRDLARCSGWYPTGERRRVERLPRRHPPVHIRASMPHIRRPRACNHIGNAAGKRPLRHLMIQQGRTF